MTQPGDFQQTLLSESERAQAAPTAPADDDRYWNFFPTPQPLADACVTVIPIEPRHVMDLGAGSGNWGLAMQRHSDYMVAKGFWKSKPYVSGVEARRVDPNEYPNLRFYDEWLHADALAIRPQGRNTTRPSPLIVPLLDGQDAKGLSVCPDVIVMNPPYSKVPVLGNRAEVFIRQAHRLVRPGGAVVALLRMAVLAGQDRYTGLWMPHAKNNPKDARPIGYRIRDPKTFHNPYGLRMVFSLPKRPTFVKEVSDPRTEYAVLLFIKGYKGRPELDYLPW